MHSENSPYKHNTHIHITSLYSQNLIMFDKVDWNEKRKPEFYFMNEN